MASHANPDGDALGSSAALGALLQALGKDVRLYNSTGRPKFLEWLPLPCPLVTSLDELGDFVPDWAFVLDCGDMARVGEEIAGSSLQLVNIDHHLGNPDFGAVNWVDPSQAAVGCMIAALAREFGVPLTGALGESLYLAIVSDTGQFSYGNTTPDVLALASEIVGSGLDVGEFTARWQNQWTLSRLRLWSLALANVQVYDDGAICVVGITRAMLEAAQATKEDCEGLVETIRRVRGVRMSITLREEVAGQIRISLRSFGDDDAQAVAQHFGGGGHRNASGATFVGTMTEAEAAVVAAASAVLTSMQEPAHG
ncbi:putative phosphoesterase RecJ domain protein [Megalodesulfovibrio gigas DSM 1382 = ATCC 19364]|uniref:Putative phosphoesterase RecJ domain protein n=1 Tax=Megalodesulfovibrio gigas (strain ATCC 19364 / DSM 1382 / NCIMB 9332 / VKM B-1759) TaxID=1121448 RepID=T2G9W8_MEGG1|nr:putative phosphoesterase RecJ domain protein [Megalodesulfovibrio gigas DSM 1382 = ATCC 19364]